MNTLIPRLGLALSALFSLPALAHEGPEHAGQHLFEHLALAAIVGLLVWVGFRLYRNQG